VLNKQGEFGAKMFSHYTDSDFRVGVF